MINLQNVTIWSLNVFKVRDIVELRWTTELWPGLFTSPGDNDFFDICNKNTKVGYKIFNNLLKVITQKLISTNFQVLKLTTAFSLIIDEELI